MKLARHTREEGTVLVAALLFALTVLGLVSAILGSGLAVKNQARYLGARQGAQHAAESAVHMCVAVLAGPGGAALLDAGTMQGTMQGSGARAPRYDVTLVRAGTDGVDNDLDGNVDEPDEGDMVEVESTGTYDGVTRTVKVTLLARYRTPEVESAAYLDDPTSDFNLSGNAFTISGIDVDLGNNPTGTLVAGVGVNGPTNLILAQISNQQEDNITGAGGEPSVQSVAEIDLTDLVHEGARSANVILEGPGNYSPPSAGAWGTLSAPAILYGTGAIKISGGAAGAGIMIINGDLEITGGFEWDGLIVVRGKVAFKGGGGGKRLTGALVLQSDIFQGLEETESSEESVTITGTVDIIFSEQTLSRMTQVFRSYTILNWREGPNPDYEATP